MTVYIVCNSRDDDSYYTEINKLFPYFEDAQKYVISMASFGNNGEWTTKKEERKFTGNIIIHTYYSSGIDDHYVIEEHNL